MAPAREGLIRINGANVTWASEVQIRDGPGMDFYERQFGKTGVELVMGNLFQADRILDSAYDRPGWTSSGWEPYITSFGAPFGRDSLDVPLDYLLKTGDLGSTVG